MALRVRVDWDKDGTFTAPFDDVTTQVRGGTAGQLEAAYGRDQGTALAPITTGRGSMVLDNRSRRYSPGNAASGLAGKLKPARPVLVERVIGSTTYTLFRGHTDDQPINPDPEARSVAFSLVDSLADFKGVQLSTPLYQGVRTGTAIGLLLDAVGWTGGRDLDLGASYLPWWWVESGDALSALDQLVRAEGPPALLTMGSDGSIVFRDRHHRITRAASTTSQATWRAQDRQIPRLAKGTTYDQGWRLVVNSATVAVPVRKPGPFGPVWSSSDQISLSDGESTVIQATASDPFFGAVTPTAGTDWQALSGVMTAQLLRDSGASVGILLKATGGPATITGLQLRAFPVPVANTVTVSAVDSTSVADYGPRGLPSGNDLPWVNPYDAAAILGLIVSTRAQPRAQIQARFVVGRDAQQAAAVLVRNMSDRVTVVEPATGTNGDYFVESFAHRLSGEDDHEVIIGLEECPAAISPVFRFDTAGAGFDQGKFGDGQNVGTSVFRFDTAGQGFDQGVFAS